MLLIQVFSTCHTLISPHVSPAKYCSHSSDAWHTHTHTHTHLASPPVHSSLSRSFPSCAEKPLGYGGTQLQMTMRSGGQCAQRGRRRSGRLPMGGPAAMRGRRPSGIPSSSPRTQRENPSLAPLRMQEHWLRQRR